MQIPDYSGIFSLKPGSTLEEIKSAHRRALLLPYQDLYPRAGNSEHRQAQEKFQKFDDAFYDLLPDKSRNNERDRVLRNQEESNFTAQYESSQDSLNDLIKYFQSLFFEGQDSTNDANLSHQVQRNNIKPNLEDTFVEFCKYACLLASVADVIFEDLLQSEMENANQAPSVWRYLGMASGGALGFVMGNIQGLAFGALGGNLLGAVRDAKGKSVYEVFTALEPDLQSQILKALAVKLLGYALSKK